VGTLKTLLGPAIDRMWENSRDIRNKVHEVNEHERALFYGNSIWALGAQPVNKTALRQMAALPLPVRRALDNTP
jgi:hypothetical protein